MKAATFLLNSWIRRGVLPILLGVVLAFSMPVRAASLDDANRAFAAGKYHASTLGYQAVLAEQGYSAAVLFDLGNSCFKEGNFPQAILAYKRAQWLSPNDPDIAANLQLAEQQAGIGMPEATWKDRLAQALSPADWAWLGSGAWVILCASLLARAAWPQRRAAFSWLSTASILVLLAALPAIFVTSGRLHEAVITDKNVSARISPFPAAQTVFSPAPGETVWVQKAYEDFVFVRDSAGHTGWISKPQVTPVVPS